MVGHTAHSRVIVVTGATRWIGLAVVTGLARAGHTVLPGTRDIERGKHTAEANSQFLDENGPLVAW